MTKVSVDEFIESVSQLEIKNRSEASIDFKFQGSMKSFFRKYLRHILIEFH